MKWYRSDLSKTLRSSSRDDRCFFARDTSRDTHATLHILTDQQEHTRVEFRTTIRPPPSSFSPYTMPRRVHRSPGNNISALTDDSNPWEQAASNQSIMEHQLHSIPPRRRLTTDQHMQQSCSDHVRTIIHRFLRVVDGLVAVLLLLWMSIILIEEGSKVAKTALILQGTFVVLVLMRFILPMLLDCPQCTLLISLLLSAGLASLAAFSYAEHEQVQTYLQRHDWLQVAWLLQSHQLQIPLLLLGVALWEFLIRWGLERCLLQSQYDTEESNDYEQLQNSSQQPWWWQRRRRHDGMDQALLVNENGVPQWVVEGRRQRNRQSRPSSWSMWLPWRRRQNQHDVRDDGSVDFVSVQEEWASRSEEDPHWWSKEDDEHDRLTISNGQSQDRNHERPREVNISWASEEHF